MFAKFGKFSKCHVFPKKTSALTCSGLKQALVAEIISPVVQKLFLREQMLPVCKNILLLVLRVLENTFPSPVTTGVD